LPRSSEIEVTPQKLRRSDRQRHRDGGDRQAGLHRQRRGQVAHLADVEAVGGEAGVDQRPAVELDEVDLVTGALERARGREEGFELLLLIAEVDGHPGGGAALGGHIRGRRPAARACGRQQGEGAGRSQAAKQPSGSL
jgi:hypothetical protein